MSNKFEEKIVKVAINNLLDEYVGECINVLYDYDKDTEEYKIAMHTLTYTNLIKDYIYKELINSDGVSTSFGIINLRKNVRFVGKKKIEEMIEKRIKKMEIEKKIKESL